MRAHTRLLVTTLLAVGLLGASGCSSGGGSAPAPVVTGNEPGTTGNEPSGGGGFESPGSAAVDEPPGSTSVNDPSGGGSGSSSGGGSGQSNCLACVTYDCSLTIDNATQSFTTSLGSSGGACLLTDLGVTLACGGAVLPGGSAIGAWTASGTGFTASAGNLGSITCTVSASTGTGGDAG
jgi:hypothetical protein